jgi:two-component system, NarL family, response regulator DevR
VIRVLLVEDHELVRRGIRDLLEAAGDIEVAVETAGVVEAETAYAAGAADVGVLDVRLPDGNGVELCRTLRDRDPQLRCLMLTSFADDEALDAAVLAGAQGYVLKDIKASDLVASVRRVASGAMLLDPATLAAVRARTAERSRDDTRLRSLSPQERRILELLREGHSNREIAERVFLAEKTVKNYVSNLLAKLGYQRRTEAALFAERTLPKEPGHTP